MKNVAKKTTKSTSASVVDSGMIAFGLVSIPFKRHVAHAQKAMAFTRLHKGCGGRIRGGGSLMMCERHNVVVKRAETIRGFEYARDQFVEFSDDEFRELETSRTGILDLCEFVPVATVGDLAVKRSSFLTPDKGGDRAYQLLASAMVRAGVVGVGRHARRGRNHLVIVRPHGRGLLLQECYRADEIRSFDDVDPGGSFELKAIENDLADALVSQLRRETFEASRYRDEWADALLGAVENKVSTGALTASAAAPQASGNVVSMLAWLKGQVRQTKAAQ